ncbi:MAG TPA: hypothetical protein VM580_25355 [Labilithrix sp.]|nr:hypothetical protein [Labilithrix sp.]
MKFLSPLLLPFLTLFAACSSGSLDGTPTAPPGDGDVAPVPDAGTPDAPEIGVEGMFARGAHALPGGGLIVLYEKPVHTKERWGRPLRSVVWTDDFGRASARRDASVGRELLDAVVHPSGDITIVEASNEGYFLVRLDAHRSVRGETHLVDDEILTDPPALGPAESRSPIEEVTHDTARLAAVGEGVFLGTRTGRHSVIAYRIDFEGSAFGVRSRTLIVPAHGITPTAMYGGTYDTFGQLDAHYGVFVAVDSSNMGWVGVGHARIELGAMVKAHAKVFGEALETDPDWLDAYVTRVSPDGKRLGTSVISTPNDEQLYGLRAIDDAVYALGRSEQWNAEGTGFDAMVARVDRHGAVALTTFDVDRGDIAFDVVAPKVGGLVVVGASGYSQNPAGASVSEESRTFARWFTGDGSTAMLDVPNGPRHNEVRFGIEHDGGLLVGGMLDGPGTHSADGDLSLLRARAFVTQARLPDSRMGTDLLAKPPIRRMCQGSRFAASTSTARLPMHRIEQ